MTHSFLFNSKSHESDLGTRNRILIASKLTQREQRSFSPRVLETERGRELNYFQNLLCYLQLVQTPFQYSECKSVRVSRRSLTDFANG